MGNFKSFDVWRHMHSSRENFTSHLCLAKSRSFLLYHKQPDNTHKNWSYHHIKIMNQLFWMLLLRQFLSEINIGRLISLFRSMLSIPKIRLNAINLTKQFRRKYINVKSIMEELPHEFSNCLDSKNIRVSGTWQAPKSIISTITCFCSRK